MATNSEIVRLLIEHRSDIFAFILASTRKVALAEEVMQNVSVVVCEKADRFEMGTNFLAWSREIARRQIMRKYQDDKRSPRPMEIEEIELAMLAFEEHERSEPADHHIEALKACLSGTTERLQNLLRLRYSEALSVEQIAERVGSPSEAVRKALYRGRLSLRACIERRLSSPGA